MKKIILSLLALVAVVGINAQSRSAAPGHVTQAPPAEEHLTFRGLPIDGKIDVFIEKMKKLGYEVTDDSDKDIIVMQGDFAGLDCEVYVVASPTTLTVWKVALYAPERDDWKAMKSQYMKFKNQYVQKYGKPEGSYEYFKDPYTEGDGDEEEAVEDGMCRYYTWWDVNGGTIALEISDYMQLRFAYEDAANSTLDDTEKSARGGDDDDDDDSPVAVDI